MAVDETRKIIMAFGQSGKRGVLRVPVLKSLSVARFSDALLMFVNS